MANVDAAFGLRPLMRTLDGGCPSTREFAKAVGYGTAIFQWDAVNRVADGSIEAAATPGTTLYSGVSLNHGKVSTATTHIVIDAPDAVFVAQDEGTGIAAVDLGLNANLVLTAGNATTGISKHEIDGATKNTTNTLDVHLLQKLDDPLNEYGAWCRVELIFNKHRMGKTQVGV